MSTILEQIVRIFGKKEEDVGIVAPASSEWIGEYPDPTFEALVEWYKRDPTVRAAIDDLAERAVGSGFYTTAEVPRAKIVVDDFCEEVDLDGLNQEIAKHGFGFGNAFIERIYDKTREFQIPRGKIIEPKPGASLINLKMLPITSVTRIFRISQGIVVGYEQRLGTQTVILSPKIMLHIPWNIVNCEAWGLGLIKTLALPGKIFTRKDKSGNEELIQRPAVLQMKQEFENSMLGFMRRYIGRYAFVWKGEKRETVKDFMKDIAKAKENEDIGLGTVKEGEVTITPLSIDPRARIEPIMGYFADQVIQGCQTPIVKLFTTPGFTEASARAAVEISERKVAAFRRQLKRIIEREIFKPVVEQNSLNWERSKVRLNWGTQSVPEVTVDHILELAKTSAQLGIDYIRPEEVRKNLQKAGFELWELKKPEVGTEGESKEGGEAE